ICSNTVKNSGSGGELNGGGAMLILNSSIISADQTAAIRCESPSQRASLIANSISINLNGKPGFLLNGGSSVASSGGFNIFNSVSGNLSTAAGDVIYSTDLNNLGSLQGGVYVWDNSKVTQSVWATVSQIDACARSFSPTVCPGVGAVFADWCGGFGVDQRGNARNAGKLLPGAYDPGLEGSSSRMMLFSASVVPFAGTSVRQIPEFGFVLDNPAGPGCYVKKMVLEGGEYVSEDGEPMLWDGNGTPAAITAFAPWAEISDNAVRVACPVNQKGQAELDAADFVLWKGLVNPATDLVDGKVKLELGHLNARLLVKVSANGVAASPSSIASLSLGGLKYSGICPLSSASPSVEADGATARMYPFAGADSYELITVPQTIPAGSFSVKLTYKGDQYEWSSSSDVTLPAGKTSSLTVNIVTTKSSSNGEIKLNGQVL
ncbi:MAG: fimbrillin family protein, partial [Candidatus Cryptobacteroides sp.]